MVKMMWRFALLLSFSSVASAAPPVCSSNADDGFTLTKFDATSEAKCIDGSPGGFYHRPGADSSIWLIEIEGGGWCNSIASCAARAKTDIGSSANWPSSGCPGMDGGSNGMLSSDCAVNPHFCNATKAHMNYCDGGSFANSLDAPLSDGNGGLLYFRGALIFNETITRLLALGMSDAREIILKGCSAGGLATFIHASFFHAWMKTAAPNARVVSMPDAGFFRDHPDINGNPYYTPQQQWVFATQNVTQVDPGCLAFYGGRSSPDAWRCFFAEYVLPHITVPLFITQDTVDSWQLPNIFRLPCEPYKSGSCNASQLAAVADYRTSMLAALGTANGGGGYFSSCIQHCHQNINAVWTQELVANTTVRDAFFSWWSGADTLPRIIVDGPWGTNAHCFGVPYHCE